jgi:hypothetical protein
MADRDKSNHSSQDIDALLADVERTLQGSGGAKPVGSTPQGRSRRLPRRREQVPVVREHRGWSPVVVPAVVSAILVGLLFQFVPFFLSTIDGTIAAFLGAMLAGLWARWRR